MRQSMAGKAGAVVDGGGEDANLHGQPGRRRAKTVPMGCRSARAITCFGSSPSMRARALDHSQSRGLAHQLRWDGV